MNRIPFLVTIDTEGDHLWKNSHHVSVHNASYLPPFQRLCESYGITPTYLVDYEMAMSGEFQEFGNDLIRGDKGEIGMHLHGWNTPPLVSLTSDDCSFHPYLFEYPLQFMDEKISLMTGLLEDTFGLKVVSHRAGRFGFSESYAALLVKHGYLVDCSVTPWVSWRNTPGDPAQRGGRDYTRFPDSPYFMDLSDISRPGDSPLLEVPVSVVKKSPFFCPAISRKFIRIPRIRHVVKKIFSDVSWLQPNGANLKPMLWMIQSAAAAHKTHLEFLLHSSELMPGGSPTFRTDNDIRILYEHLEELFSLAHNVCRPMTLKNFHSQFVGAMKIPSKAEVKPSN